jgi:sensor histidine kinase YesM
MNRVKNIFTLLYSVGWFLIFLFFCWAIQSEGHSNWVFLSATMVLASVAIFFSHLFILTRYLNRKKIGLYLLGLILLFTLSPFLYLWQEKGEIYDWHSFRDQYFTTLFSFVLFSIVLSWIGRATENRFLNTLKRESLEKQALRAELALLKSQINPHFLFNTLNNIHTLAYKASPPAAEAIMGLSSLMRYMLYESNSDTVALQREIDYVQDFINLQGLRYKEKSIVDLKISGNTETCRVAPLLFVHLIENAYKHSPVKLKPGDIKVSIEVKEKRLTFSVENPVGNSKLRPIDERGGFGLSNVKKRLQLLYPQRHSFEVDNTDNLFKVVLTIPVQIQGDAR